eukprot:SAG31_NODE_14644_length_795_cov_0.961207_1_plen_147_part_01
MRIEARRHSIHVFLDGQLRCREDRPDRAEFSDVVVYASDPWYEPAAASIENFFFAPLPMFDDDDAQQGDVRLSAYPMGRIEVFNDGSWGTVCGHWFWDSNNGADIVCRSLRDESGEQPYAGGTVYTAGCDSSAGCDRSMPIHTGCTV